MSVIPVTCEIAFPSDPAAAPDWKDVSQFVREVTIRRGREHELGTVEPGTCTVVLANRDRRFDPTYAGLFTGPRALTVSGNEITDATRALGVQGDGRRDDGSFGLWEATTNLAYKNYGGDPIAGAGFVSGTGPTKTAVGDGWYDLYGGTGAAATFRILVALADLTNGETYTCSVFSDDAFPAPLLDWCDVSATRQSLALGNGTTRYWVTSARATYDSTFRFFDITVPAGTTVRVRWAQVEHQPIPTPYSASASARPAARVQAPASLLNETQGWVAMRVRRGWVGAVGPHNPNGTVYFSWFGANDHAIYLERNNAGGWNWRRRTPTENIVGALADVSAQTGDYATLVMAWTATQVKFSLNGGAFSSVNATAIPTLGALFDVGSYNGLYQMDSDVLWFACGTGTLTDTAIADLHRRLAAGEEPSLYELNEAYPNAKFTGVFPFETADFDTLAPYYPNVVPMRRIRILAGENRLANPSFEGALTSWSIGGSPTHDTTTFLLRGGSCRIPAATYQYVFQDVALSPGTYTVSVWRKTDGHTSASGSGAGLRTEKPGGSTVVFSGGQISSTNLGTRGWERISATLTVTTAGVVRFLLTGNYGGTGSGTVWFDGAQLNSGKLQGYVDSPYLFTGFVERWPPTRRGPSDAYVTLDCIDALAPLAAVEPNLFYGAQLSGARIAQVLNDVGWPTADRSLDAGQSQMDDVDLVDSGTSALDHIQQVAESENGIAFADTQGRLVFHDRHRRLKSPYTTSQGTFGDAAGELPYVGLEPSYDLDELWNDVRLTVPSDPMAATASDSASQTRYLRRTLSRSTILASWTEASYAAAYLLSRFKDPYLRFDSLVLRPNTSNADDLLWPHALSHELGDRITVRHRPPGGGAVIEVPCHIEGIEHRIVGTRWETRWQLSPAEQNAYLVFDDPIYGRLDYNRLAY